VSPVHQDLAQTGFAARLHHARCRLGSVFREQVQHAAGIPLGSAIFQYMDTRPSAHAVRYRRRLIAGLIDRAARHGGTSVLAIAAGLYDYLSAPVAAALTRRMFDMTRPGGLMLIPNFLTGVRDTGYMESFMDWHLIYRDHADMEALAAALPHSHVENYQVFDDDHEAITYLLVSKK